MSEESPKFLSAVQVADRYGLPVSWVYGCKELKKYARKAGKYLRFELKDIEAFERRRSEWPRTPESGKKAGSRGYTLQGLMRHQQERQTNERNEKAKKAKIKFDIL